MNVILEFSIIPIGTGSSLSKYVAACEDVLAKSGLHYELHANGTNVEGEWDVVFAAVKHCHEALHKMGVSRISTMIKVGTRTDRLQTLQNMVASIEEKLGRGNRP